MLPTIEHLIGFVKNFDVSHMEESVKTELLAVLDRAKGMQISFALLLKIAAILFTEPIQQAIQDIIALLNTQPTT